MYTLSFSLWSEQKSTAIKYYCDIILNKTTTKLRNIAHLVVYIVALYYSLVWVIRTIKPPEKSIRKFGPKLEKRRKIILRFTLKKSSKLLWTVRISPTPCFFFISFHYFNCRVTRSPTTNRLAFWAAWAILTRILIIPILKLKKNQKTAFAPLPTAPN